MIGENGVGVGGMLIILSESSLMSWSFCSAMLMIFAPRAFISMMFPIIFSCVSSGGVMKTTGKPGSTRAIGPCLDSPAG